MSLSAPSCQQQSSTTPRKTLGLNIMLDRDYWDSPGARKLDMVVGPCASAIPLKLWSLCCKKEDPSGEIQIVKEDLFVFYGSVMTDKQVEAAWSILNDERHGFLRHVEGDTYYCRGWKERTSRWFSEKARKAEYYQKTKNGRCGAPQSASGEQSRVDHDHDQISLTEVSRSEESPQTGAGSPGSESTQPTQSLPPPEISPVSPPQTEVATPTSTDPPKPLQGEIGPSMQAPSKEKGLPEMNSLGQLLSQSEVTEQTEQTEQRDTPPPGVDAKPAADSPYHKPGASSTVRFLMSRGAPCYLSADEVSELNTLRPTEHEMVKAYGAATARGKFERGLFFARLRDPKTVASPTPTSKQEPAMKNPLTTPRQIKSGRVSDAERPITAEESAKCREEARRIRMSIS